MEFWRKPVALGLYSRWALMFLQTMKKKYIFIFIIAVCAVFAFFAKSNSDTDKQAVCLDGDDWKLSYAKQPFSGAAKSPEEFKLLKDVKTVKAKVPGNCELDLQKAGVLPDLQKGDNIYLFRPFEGYQWLYSKKFKAPDFNEKQKLFINFGGIDTLGDVFVNGHLVGSSDNMFVSQKFDISNVVNKGVENLLEVVLRSPVIESAKYDDIAGSSGGNRAELIHIRKAPASFGWDIHPRLVNCGLFKSVSLQEENEIAISEFYPFTLYVEPSKNRAMLAIDLKIQAPFEELDKLTVKISVGKDGKEIASYTKKPLSYNVKDARWISGVDLWYPRGYGEQPLYDIKVGLLDKSGKTLAECQKKMGFRTLRLEFSEIELSDEASKKVTTSRNGEAFGDVDENSLKGEFKFYVNDVPIFIRGTNWVPLDASHSRDLQHVQSAMDMLVDLNCNMVRCWGGNVYESEKFFDLCDKYGILVWQDFAMGCSVYPQTEEFYKKIRKEVAFQVKRLRHRTSLALYAGNNENDQAYNWRIREKMFAPQHDTLSRDVIPAVIREYDWIIPYLPSSPYMSEKTVVQNKKFAPPEAHLWGPRGYYKIPFYTNAICRFVSEIGYHGCPNKSSLQKMMDKDYVYPFVKGKDFEFNKQWQCKAVMPYRDGDTEARRNMLMVNQIKHLFGECPKDLDEFIFASQSVQAEAKKYFIEHWRSQKFAAKTGIIWWNLRDAWPILSDAIVDYYNSKKLAYYYIKRAQKTVCCMVNDKLELVAVNDSLKPAKGSVKVVDIDSNKELFSGEFAVNANSKGVIAKLKQPTAQGMLLITYKEQNEKDENLNHYMYGKPPFKLAGYKKWNKALKIVRD